jgi:hypothetical protein
MEAESVNCGLLPALGAKSLVGCYSHFTVKAVSGVHAGKYSDFQPFFPIPDPGHQTPVSSPRFIVTLHALQDPAFGEQAEQNKQLFSDYESFRTAKY